MKVVLIGDSSVGKSALVSRFTKNQVPQNSMATVGISFCRQMLIDPETNEKYTIQIWDTAGQEKFQSVTTHHYRAADGALLCYDVTSEASFRSMDRWLQELYDNTDPSVVVMVVGTKVDLMQQRVITEERARAYARKNGLLYAETSSLWDKRVAGRGVSLGADAIFVKLVQAIVEKHQDMGHNPLRMDLSGFAGKVAETTASVRLGRDERRGNDGCEC